MAKEFSWDVRGHKLTASLKGNKYVLNLDDDYLTNVYRLHPSKMRYGLEASITVLGEKFIFVVWEEVPDLVVDGRMLHRGVDFRIARENRRRNMENMYTATAIFGVIALLGVFLFAWFGLLHDENLSGWTAVMTAGIWMVGMGLYYRGKWIEQIP